MTSIRLRGINPIRKPLASGRVVVLHYLRGQKGVPPFWRSDSDIKKGTPAYFAAYEAACGIERRPTSEAQDFLKGLIRDYFRSDAFIRLAPRTQKDYALGLRDVEEKWGKAPRSAVEAAEFTGAVLKWIEANWRGKNADKRLTPFKRLLSWAGPGPGKRNVLTVNRLADIPTYYRSTEANRAEIIWLPDEVDEFCATAYPELARAAAFERETGMRPGDLVKISLRHVHPTPEGGRVIIFRPSKGRGKRVAQVPVTPEAARIIDSTPPGQLLIIKPPRAARWTEEHLSKEVSDHLRAIGLKEGRHQRLLDTEAKVKELRLYDLRGTCCTRLVKAGLTIDQLALHMGWTATTAAQMLNIYLALDTGQADAVIAKLGFAPKGADTRPGSKA